MGAIILLVCGGTMIALGRQWTEDPANIGAAFVLVLGYLVSAVALAWMVALFVRRR